MGGREIQLTETQKYSFLHWYKIMFTHWRDNPVFSNHNSSHYQTKQYLRRSLTILLEWESFHIFLFQVEIDAGLDIWDEEIEIVFQIVSFWEPECIEFPTFWGENET